VVALLQPCRLLKIQRQQQQVQIILGGCRCVLANAPELCSKVLPNTEHQLQQNIHGCGATMVKDLLAGI
jgi:hypothetical protein